MIPIRNAVPTRYPPIVTWLATAIPALGGVYWLVRDQDMRERTRVGD
jgi:hypothetical protein